MRAPVDSQQQQEQQQACFRQERNAQLSIPLAWFPFDWLEIINETGISIEHLSSIDTHHHPVYRGATVYVDRRLLIRSL